MPNQDKNSQIITYNTPSLLCNAIPLKEGNSTEGSEKFPSGRGVPEGRGVFKTVKWHDLPFNPKLKQRAKELRKAGNLSEVLFWNQVKNKQFLNLDFDRQKIIGNYIVDFYCKNLGIVVEIDGQSHNEKQEYDQERDNFLESLGLKIFHFQDIDIKNNLNGVMEFLRERLLPCLQKSNNTPPCGHPSFRGELKKMKKLLTLCIIHQHPKILLGLKKRGFGAGKWNGFGGKVSPSETIEDAAKRELQEEAGIKAEHLDKVGVLEFEFKGNPEILEVHIFKSNNFSGEPVESEEMKPQWFHVNEIPFEKMWPDDEYWLPLFMGGKKFKGKFLFGKSDIILEKKLVEVGKI